MSSACLHKTKVLLLRSETSDQVHTARVKMSNKLAGHVGELDADIGTRLVADQCPFIVILRVVRGGWLSVLEAGGCVRGNL